MMVKLSKQVQGSGIWEISPTMEGIIVSQVSQWVVTSVVLLLFKNN